jgi:hypothetical protein
MKPIQVEPYLVALGNNFTYMTWAGYSDTRGQSQRTN